LLALSRRTPIPVPAGKPATIPTLHPPPACLTNRPFCDSIPPPLGKARNGQIKGGTLATESFPARSTTWSISRSMGGLLALLLLGGALGLLALGWEQTAAPLTVEVDGRQYLLRTHATTVGEALRRAGFTLHPEDRISPGPAEPLRTGIVVRIQRARPVQLQADGRIRSLRTHAETVGDLLAEAGVKVHPADEIRLGGQIVGPDTLLTAVADGGPPFVSLRRAISVTLNDDGVTMTLVSTQPTVGRVLQEQKVQLYPGDAITPDLQTAVTPGLVITVERSLPVEIRVDGRTIHTRTLAKTVGGVLAQEGIVLAGRDRATPDLDEPLRAGMTIQITRVREEFVVEFDPIPFATVWVPDPEVEIDHIRLVQEGQTGLNKRRYRVVYENGREVERVLEDSWAERPPITKTMAYGTKIVIRTLDTPYGPVEYWRKMRVYVTSYKPSSCGKPKDHPRYGYTRLGIKLRKGIVAVDPTVIPLKTWMYVPGYGIAKAGDTGGGVKGKFVDLGFSDDDYESWHWWMDIYLLTPVPPPSKIRYVLPDWPKFPDRGRWSR